MLLGDNGGVVETELRKFVAMRPSWQANTVHPIDLDPGTFIGMGWKFADVDADLRSLTLAEADFSKVLYETCCSEGETHINGEEKLRRLITLGGIRLDPRFGVALFQEKKQKLLERLYKERGITYLDFFGRVLVYPLGGRCVLGLYRNVEGRWSWDAYFLSLRWEERRFSARLAS